MSDEAAPAPTRMPNLPTWAWVALAVTGGSVGTGGAINFASPEPAATKADIVDLDERVDGIDERVDSLDDKIDVLDDKIDDRLDALTNALERIEYTTKGRNNQ